MLLQLATKERILIPSQEPEAVAVRGSFTTENCTTAVSDKNQNTNGLTHFPNDGGGGRCAQQSFWL